MSPQFLVAIDQGTTGSTVLVLAPTPQAGLEVIAKATEEFPQHYPVPGWVEHDLDEIWVSVQKAVTRALEQARSRFPGFSPLKIAAIGITNQRETLCVYERKGLTPLCRAIVWQCKRSGELCEDLRAQAGLDSRVREKTGLLIDPYFSGSKLRWLMEHRPEVARQLKAGTAVVGTIDTYLVSRLSRGHSFVTEASNASRTLLFNIHTGSWDEELMALFAVPRSDILAEVKDSAGVFAHTADLGFLPAGIPITGILGDQQAALAGQTCFGVGEAKCTYGTGAFLLWQLGPTPQKSAHGLLTTVAWRLDGHLSYALEGSSFVAGAAIQFARDQLGFIETAAQSEALAASAVGAPEVYFVPALAGLGAPWWSPNARGAFFGLTRGTSRAQLVRAVIEGMAFQVCDLLAAMAAGGQGSLKVLRVDGGASANRLLLQLQADLAGVVVERPSDLETTALGAALFAGLGIGLYSGLEELAPVRKVEARYEPSQEAHAVKQRQEQLAGWQRAVKAVQVFAGVL